MQLKTHSIICLLLFIAPCLTKAIEPKNPRTVKLTGQNNFRDLGEYETEDGHRIKKGILYRSGELQKLTDEDISYGNEWAFIFRFAPVIPSPFR